MDCDDKPGSNAYLMNGNTLRASPNLGWKDDYVGEEYSAWHVHPFSPVNLHTCNLMSYDFNCNKGRDDGYDYSLLKQGGTPFDWDISTGREYAEPGGLLNAFSYPADLDMACHTENAYKPAIKKTMGAVAIVILIVGVSSFGIGALVKAGVVAKGSLLASIGVGSGSAGMVGGLALSATDALICISSLLDRKNADWSWSGVTEHCVGMTIDATLFGVSMVGRGLSKGKLLLSTAGKSDDAYRAVRVLGKDDDASRAMLTGLDDVADNARFIDAPRPGCFLAGTQIMLANGTLANIEDIKVGDMIMAYDLANKSAVAAPVTTTFARNATEYLIIEYEPV